MIRPLFSTVAQQQRDLYVEANNRKEVILVFYVVFMHFLLN